MRLNSPVLATISVLGTNIYSTGNGGIVSPPRAAAVELKPLGIRVNSVQGTLA
jgi:hypothetical protein